MIAVCQHPCQESYLYYLILKTTQLLGIFTHITDEEIKKHRLQNFFKDTQLLNDELGYNPGQSDFRAYVLYHCTEQKEIICLLRFKFRVH